MLVAFVVVVLVPRALFRKLLFIIFSLSTSTTITHDSERVLVKEVLGYAMLQRIDWLVVAVAVAMV